MKVAVLSGKGGTGKTLISCNLAAANQPITYLDADVEAPNGHLFFKPEIKKQYSATKLYPHFDPLKCNGCRKCVDFCKFNALAFAKQKILFMPTICHSCQGCVLVCPNQAISEVERKVGEIKVGTYQQTTVITGIMDIGQESGVSIINDLKKEIITNDVVIDCPPGSACLTAESIKDADYCVIVVELTKYGMSNMKMVKELCEVMHKPYGFVINKATDFDLSYFKENNLPVLETIPYSQEIAKLNSASEIIVNHEKKYQELFINLWHKIKVEYQQVVK